MNNQLFYGDNLEVLRRHIKDESVDLCYIDPPFNSKRNYNQIYNNIGKEDRAQAQAFIDTWTWDDFANRGLLEIKENYHGRFSQKTVDLICGLEPVLGKGSLFAYLVNMTLRIVEIHRVLKPTGSFYLHCDPSALALKKDDRTRKEFEKWAVLTYTNNRATINDKKGADKGIDGIVFFDGGENHPEKIIIQVKLGKVKSGDIRDLQGTMTLNEATLGIFLTFNEPIKDMIKTAKEAGIYQSKFMSNPVDKINIITIKEIVEEQKRLDIRLVLEVLKSAEKQTEIKSDQIKINFSD